MANGLSTDEELAKANLCQAIADFYEPGARELIGRTCLRYLANVRITPTELLHDPAKQLRLLDAGTNLASAVQQSAVAQVRGTKTTIGDRVKQLYALTDELRLEAKRRLDGDPAEPLTRESLILVLPARPGEAPFDHRFRVNAALTATLAPLTDWASKFALLLDLSVMADDPEGVAYFDELLAEILRFPDAFKASLGAAGNAAIEMDRLISLITGGQQSHRVNDEPPTAEPFRALLGRAAMPACRDVLRTHLVKTLAGSAGLGSMPVPKQIDWLVQLHGQMQVDGQLMGGTVAEQGFGRRFSRLISEETIDLVMARLTSSGERIRRAFELRALPIGDTAREFLTKYIDVLLNDPRLEDNVLPRDLPLVAKLKLLADLHGLALRASYSAAKRQALAEQFEAMQERLIRSSDLYGQLEKRPGTTADKALAVVDLCCNGVFTAGRNVRMARQVAGKYLKRGDFLPSYLEGAGDDGEKTRRLVDLKSRLLRAGLGER